MGRFDAAHQLDDNRNLRIGDNIIPVIGQQRGLHTGTRFGCIADENVRDFNRCACNLRHVVCTHRQQLVNAGADGSETEQRNFNRFVCHNIYHLTFSRKNYVFLFIIAYFWTICN